MDRRWDQGYTSLLRMSRFMAMVRSGDAAGVVDVKFPGTPPRGLRFRLRTEGQSLSGSPSGAASGVLVRIRFTSPQTHELRVAGGAEKLTPKTHSVDPADLCTWTR